jgi:hypothetical protein
MGVRQTKGERQHRCIAVAQIRGSNDRNGAHCCPLCRVCQLLQWAGDFGAVSSSYWTSPAQCRCSANASYVSSFGYQSFAPPQAGTLNDRIATETVSWTPADEWQDTLRYSRSGRRGEGQQCAPLQSSDPGI